MKTPFLLRDLTGVVRLTVVFIFGKNEQDNLTDEQVNQLRKVIERW